MDADGWILVYSAHLHWPLGGVITIKSQKMKWKLFPAKRCELKKLLRVKIFQREDGKRSSKSKCFHLAC